MILSPLKSAALAAALSLTSLAATAQTFGEFLNKPELPLTFMGVDYSNAKYYGDAMTVSPAEMKTQFTKINELLVKEADKYDLQKALQRSSSVQYSIFYAESANQKMDPGTVVVPESVPPRAAFTAQKVEGLVTHYTYPASGRGVGLVFMVESIDKKSESEVFWATFVDLATKKVLYTQKLDGKGAGFGFRNHWAAPLNAGIKDMKSHYSDWKKKSAGK